MISPQVQTFISTCKPASCPPSVSCMFNRLLKLNMSNTELDFQTCSSAGLPPHLIALPLTHCSWFLDYFALCLYPWFVSIAFNPLSSLSPICQSSIPQLILWVLSLKHVPNPAISHYFHCSHFSSSRCQLSLSVTAFPNGLSASLLLLFLSLPIYSLFSR